MMESNSYSVKILIVEDDNIVAKNFKAEFELYGYVVVGIADNGEEAIQILKNHNPDIALLDIQLKGNMTGIDVGKHINKTSKIPFIYLSDHTHGRVYEETMLTKPAGYLPKPMTARQMLHMFSVIMTDHSEKKGSKNGFFKGNDFFIRQIEFDDEKRLTKINVEDILYINYDGGIEFFLESLIHEKKINDETVINYGKLVMLEVSMVDFMRQFPHPKLTQISRNQIVNNSRITSIIDNFIEITGYHKKLTGTDSYMKSLKELIVVIENKNQRYPKK